ncbi:hypothetical protein MRS44_000955 [Fusarium solani]|uniref:uncharacterized protein n=1 Tax=Fusarium solani TaxID=169388 RepID=UPI0032C426A6|nr:hypothetical protein MRS44_000955 [Fusarium solani]
MAHIDPASVPAIDDDLETWLDVEGLCEDSSDDPGQNATTAQHDISSTLTSVQTPLDHNPQSEAQPAGQENRACPKSRRKTTTRTNPSVNYSVICFPSNPAKPDGIKKKRKDFDEKRRLEVAQVRKTGACFRCKVRRISTDILDLHYIDYTARLLDQELIAGTTHLGPPRKVSISMDYVDNPALEVEVQDYYGNKTPPWLCCWVVMNQVDGHIELHREESARYALPQLLPSSDLVDWVENIIVHQDTRCIGFQQAVDAFIMRYSKSSASLPMHGFVRKVHKLNCLIKIRLGLVLCVEEDGKTTPPSCALHTQFGQISKAASQPIEKEVLSELEKLMFGTAGIGPDNAIALWASLWCLILMYRKLVRSYIAFQQFPCHVPEDYSGFPECKLEVGTHFYHYLVSIYAALFRVTSPLYTDFRVAATRKLLDEDESLVRAFMNLRTESFYFQRESCSMTAPQDQLLRRMILDREAGLKPKQLSAT